MKRPYTPPQGRSRRWCEETLPADAWRDIIEMSDGFAFVDDREDLFDVWPVVPAEAIQ